MGIRERNALLDLLDRFRIEYRITHHEPTYTSKESAEIRRRPLASGVKALLFKELNDSKYFVILVRADHHVDIVKLSSVLKTNRIRLARTRELLKITGCKPGSVHPFGTLYNVLTIIDNKIIADKINFNAGTHDSSIEMKLDDLMNLVRPIVYDITSQ